MELTWEDHELEKFVVTEGESLLFLRCIYLLTVKRNFPSTFILPDAFRSLLQAEDGTPGKIMAVDIRKPTNMKVESNQPTLSIDGQDNERKEWVSGKFHISAPLIRLNTDDDENFKMNFSQMDKIIVDIICHLRNHHGLTWIEEAIPTEKHISVDGKNWEIFRPSKVSIPVIIAEPATINRELLGQFLTKKHMLLKGFFHLDAGFNSDSLSKMIVEFATAAELGIKEFLITYKPELLTLITKVPSPPLKTLYGDVLSEIVGKGADKKERSTLNKISELRNQVIHSPGEHKIPDRKTVLEYGEVVKRLLLMLTDILHPKDAA